jgi:hypothetical protein
MRQLFGISPRISLAAVLMMTAGCNWLVPIGVLTAPRTEKVPAEFDKLAGSKALILVWAEPDTLFDYPNVRLEVNEHVAAQIKTRLSDVRFVPAKDVEDYLQRSTSSTQDPLAVGQHFAADKVIHVVLLEFSMRDREMAHFYRGRIHASVTVYDLKDKSGTPQRYTLNEVSVVYPPDRPVGFDASAATVVRQKTYESFADVVGRKFYSYDKDL